MPATTPCVPCCTTPQSVDIPGSPGATGPAGTNGTNGINAFTFTLSNFTTPALSGNVTIEVGSSAWAIPGQPIVVDNGTATGDTYVVASIPDSTHIVATYLNYASNVNAGNVVNAGAGVSPSGFQTAPVTPTAIADGGTGATTKAGAQTALGLGQDAHVTSVTGLTQAVTASFATVAGCTVTIPAAGSWLYSAHATVDWVGVTFASSRTVTLKIRNTTQGVDLAVGTWQTQALTTLNLPSSDFNIPFKLDATAIAADVVELMITVSVVNSAGTFQVTAGSLCAVPIRLS